MDIFMNKPDPTAPEAEVEQRMTDYSVYVAAGDQIIDRREDKSVFASTETAGSSAIYAKDGGTLYLKDAEIHGYGAMTNEDLKNELASKYGFCAAVLANCKTSHVTLVDPKIVCHEGSNANGAYAIFHGAVVIKGGTIDTNNRLGHGVDCSYGGHIYCDGTVIHTGGGNSGALATDFQGGYITVRNIHATTEIGGSPGIYTAGKSIITAYDSTFISKGCEAVMVAHTLGHTYLYGCDVTGVIGLNTHNGMGDEYSYIHMYGGKLKSTGGALLNAEDGKAVMNLDGVKIVGIGDGNFMSCQGGGKLVANISNMTVKGNASRQEKSYTELNLAASSFEGAANVTKLSVDGASQWNITGDSKAAVLSIAPGAKISAAKPVTVTYGQLESGTSLPSVEGVTFVRNGELKDDYEAKKMGPPPGAENGPGHSPEPNGPSGPFGGMPGMPGGAPPMPQM